MLDGWQMSVIFDGKERTAQEFVELARATGWKVTRSERGEGTLFGCTTCVPVWTSPAPLVSTTGADLHSACYA